MERAEAAKRARGGRSQHSVLQPWPVSVARSEALCCTPPHSAPEVSERAASDALNGRVVRNRSALRNPEIIDQLLEHPQLKT